RVDSGTRRASRAVPISGADGRVLSIALRPADGKLYGLTDKNQLVTIDPMSGRATPGAKLDKPVETGPRAAINFNPTVDRLRVVGMGGGNYRIHPDTGAVTADGALKYAPGTPFASTSPMVTAAAYTNHMAGAKETMLLTVDTMLGQINLQAPPNDGVQQPKKQLDGTLPKGMGFDILADGQGGNIGYMIVGSTLMSLAVADLTVSTLGPVAGLPAGEVVSLAVSK
ncbi:MAG: DUF4394 domain-containing protein, partial [Gemmatimonadaceae bacterium]|nr:DUF4394 domain-containing protein [Acetobacteraceae bacterium]